MTIEADVMHALKTYAPLDSLIAGRIWPNTVPSSSGLPCVVYQRISTVFQQSVGRSVAAEDVRLQFGAWATTDEAAAATAREVVQAILAMTSHQSRHTHATKIDNEIADWDPSSQLQRRIVDVILVSTEAA